MTMLGNPDSSWATLDTPETLSQSGQRDIIAIGAAAGGLSLICKLLARLPVTFDAAILIALDIGSQPASSVLQILRGYSRLPVSYATDGALVRRGCVMLAPVRHHMKVSRPGIVMLENERSFSGDAPSVNRLFETCAAVYGQRVVGVVLSGASHDGTVGLTCIEAAGGVGVVQDPEEAFDSSMPSNALWAARTAYCSVLDRMVPLLITLASGATPFASLGDPRSKSFMSRSA